MFHTYFANKAARAARDAECNRMLAEAQARAEVVNQAESRLLRPYVVPTVRTVNLGDFLAQSRNAAAWQRDVMARLAPRNPGNEAVRNWRAKQRRKWTWQNLIRF